MKSAGDKYRGVREMNQGIKREMRRKDRQLAPKEAEEILLTGKYGILSIICEDGCPYGLPLSYAYGDGKLYFHHTSEEIFHKI